MNINIINTKRKSFALITVLVVTLLLLITATFFLTSAIFEVKITRNQVFDKKSFHVAEAGIQESFNYMKNHPGLVESGHEISGTLDSMDYTCVTSLNDDEGAFSKLYEVVCTVDDAITGARKRISAVVRIQTYSKYAYFTNSETSASGSDVWFMGVSDTMKDIMGRKAWIEEDQASEGLIHTNGRFNFFGNPEFWCYITSVDQYVQFYPNKIEDADTYPPNHIPVYMKPFSRGVAEIDFPENINHIDLTPPSKTLNIPANSTIELNGTEAIINDVPQDISNIWVIRASGDITELHGILDGYLTIASDGDIFITDNIIYAEESTTSDDILGIYAQNNVVIKNDENVSPGVSKEITVDAAIMALNELTIYPFEGSDHAGNPVGRKPGSILHVNGGVTQNSRGVMGHFNPLANKVEDGYVRDYRYDERLKSFPPPFFPTTGEPEIISWKEEVIE